MKDAYFERKRHYYDWIFFAAGIASLFILAQFYSSSSRDFTPRGFLNKADHIVDSILTARDISPDTVSVVRAVSSDGELIQTLSDSIGVLATTEYLQEHSVYQHQFLLRIRVNHNAGFNFDMNSGNVSSRSRENAATISNLITNVWCDGDGNIVGAQEILKDGAALHLDSARAFTRLFSMLPPDLQNTDLQWENIPAEDREIKFQAVTGKDELTKRTLTMQARTRSDGQELVSWRLDADPLMSQVTEPQTSSGNTKLIMTILIVLIILGLMILGTVRLVKRAVSLPSFIVLAFLSGAYYFLASTDIVELHWAVLLLIFVFQLILLGILCFALPICGIFSLAREVFPAKFYTLLRIQNRPHASHFTGRSILIGLSIGFVYAACVPLFMEWMSSLGRDAFLYGFVFNDSVMTMSMFSPPAILLGMIVYSPVVNAAAILLFPVLAYRYAPTALQKPLAIGGAILASILASTILGTDISFGATFGILSSICAVYLLLRHDVLSILAFNFAGGISMFMFVFESQPILAPILAVITIAVIGFAILAYTRPPEAVSEEDYKPSFLYRIEEEKRIQREIEAAKTVQQRLLPEKLPNFPAVNIAASCVPAFEVGGDYYDFFTLDEHRLGLLIGDVSGKGMTAAFYITLAKGVIVSQIRQSGSAADVMHRVNSLLYGVMERGRFISMIYAVYDTRTGVLEFANAGHNPMLRRIGASGEVETVDSRGMAIGLDSGKVFDRAVVSQKMQLEPNDVVVFYTDGVTEAMQNSREEFSEERLIKCISKAKSNAADVVSYIIDSVNRFVGKARQHDDITILAIQVKENTLSDGPAAEPMVIPAQTPAGLD